MPVISSLAAFAACVLWAVSFIATKVALAATPPLTVVALRLTLAAICFALWLACDGGKALRAARERPMAVFGLSLVGTSLHFSSQTVGLQYTTASNASLFTVTGPITIAVLGLVFLGERINLRKAVGIFLALVGVLCVMGAGTLRDLDLGRHLGGDVLVFASIVMWGAFTVFGKQLTDEMGALGVTAMVTVIGAVTMVPVGAVEIIAVGFDFRQMSGASWGAIAFLGLACSFLATLLYFIALERSEAQKVGVFLYTIPPMTVIVAHLALGEVLSLGFFIGSALVLGGVVLTERG